MNKQQYISVMGYGWSGSGALMDLLREFDSIGELGMELRILRDPHGVIDLEYQMIERWDALNLDIAIKEFLALIKKLARKRTKFLEGGNHEIIFHNQFYKCSQRFIENITSYQYMTYWWYIDFRLSYIKWWKQRLMKRFGNNNFGENAYFGKVTKEEFHLAVQEYIDDLVVAYNKDATYEYFIIEQAFLPNDPGKASDYCKNAKIIVVDRDPRDIYVELVKKKKLIGYDIIDSHDTMKFVEWHKSYRNNISEEKTDLLRIQFEDLIYKYDETLKKVIDFLEVEGKKLHHVRPRTLFKAEESAQNIGQYKEYAHQEEIKVLEKELKEYLWEFDV